MINRGVLYAGSAYILWGFLPLYFHLLGDIAPVQVLGHRIVWSFVLLVGVMLVRWELVGFARALTRRVVLTYLAAAVLLALNWYVYVWAVASGFVVEASLGYFINPLVSVLLGVVILHERLRPLQWIPVGLATAGVAVLAFSYGSVPWIALVLAFSFGTYGLIKKMAPLGSLPGLTLEATLLFPVAFLYLGFVGATGSGAFGPTDPLLALGLALLGPITVIPLLLFASGARRVTLTTLGLLQYFAPTLQFMIGVFVFREPMTVAHLVGFVIIWIALALFSAEGVTARRRRMAEGAGAGVGAVGDGDMDLTFAAVE
jgi:chloramphenicol-sensitive protein RarD